MIDKGREYALPEDFITEVFNAIHKASVSAQNNILAQDDNKEPI
jgi:chorismate mutase